MIGRRVFLQGLKIQGRNELLKARIGSNSFFRKYSDETKVYVEHKKVINGVEVENEEDEYYVDVSDLENRWRSLNFESQQDIISYLNVKQEFDWNYLSQEEKKAIYYIAYGKWGARDEQIMNTSEFVFKLMTSMLLFSVLGFSIMNYAIDQEKIAELTKEDNTPE